MTDTSIAEEGMPAIEDFAALLDESYGASDSLEGTVIKGTVINIENDLAIIDVGLKSEGRIPLPDRTPNSELEKPSRFFWNASKTPPVKPSFPGTRHAARKPGKNSKWRSTRASASMALSSAA